MKKIFLLLFFFPGMCWADSKLTQLTQDTTAQATDLLYKVDNPAGTPQSRSIALKDLLGQVAVSSMVASGVTAGTYGSATQVSSMTVNAQGNITGAANVTISLTNSNLQSGTYSNVTIPAANVASGSLGPTVLVASLTAVVGAGSCTNCNATFNDQGQVTSFLNGSSGTISTITAGINITVANSTGPNVTVNVSSSPTFAGPVTFSSTTAGLFELICDAAQMKLPGSNVPFISNSTSEASASVYLDDTSTQSATCSGLVTRYDGRPIYVDIVFTSTATSGTVNFAVYTDTKSTTSNYDTNNFNVAVTSSVTVSPNSNAPVTVTMALSNTTTTNGQLVIYKLEREAGLSDTSVGFARVKKMRIYE